MIEAQRENLNINKLIAERKEILLAEGDMIVPDSKPDILNTIGTSGIASIYKKEVQSEKVRLDGMVNAYIMYMPDEYKANAEEAYQDVLALLKEKGFSNWETYIAVVGLEPTTSGFLAKKKALADQI